MSDDSENQPADEHAPSTESDAQASETDQTAEGDKAPEGEATPSEKAPNSLASEEPVGEMTDREQRRKKKKEARAKKLEALKSKNKEADEIDKAMAGGKLGAKKKAQRKQQLKYAAIALFAVLVFWFGNYLFAPYQADLRYGICRIYLENSVRFPKYLRLSTVEDVYKNNVDIYPVRIWYTQLDAFGEYRLENIQCEFKYDPELGTILDRILVNRREVSQKKVDRFNVVLPLIAANPPDLAYPAPLPDSLQDLQINTDSLRFQLNIPGIN